MLSIQEQLNKIINLLENGNLADQTSSKDLSDSLKAFQATLHDSLAK